MSKSEKYLPDQNGLFNLYDQIMALSLAAAEFADEAADSSTGPTSAFEARERGRASAFAEAAELVKALFEALQPLSTLESPEDAPETTLQRFWREVKDGTATFVTPDGQPTGPNRNRDNKPESRNG